MNIRHKALVIDPEKPFSNCKLGREKYGNILTGIVGNYLDGFVLAINNRWGTGKTTFLQMWQQSLQLKDISSLYFNAWENDFEASPLVALMGELKGLITLKNKVVAERNYKLLLEKGATIAKNTFPHIIKALAAKYLGNEVVSEIMGDATEGLTEIFEQEVTDYTNKKVGLQEFKNPF